MKRLSKNRILSLFLALTMIFTAMPISSVGANAIEATPISILYNGLKVDNLVLMEDEKITLTTSASGSDSLSYRWQIRVDEESDKWVNIKGYTKDFCIVSYALIGSLLDTNGNAYLRCKATDGVNDYLSNTLTVNVSYNAPITYEKAEEISETSAPAKARYILRTANNNASLAADEELKSCNIVINYKYEDNSLAFEPFVATIEYGGAFNYTAVSPTVVGYAPYILQGDTYVDAKNVELNYASLTKDKVIDVIYRPVPVDYTVLHYTQNILDDNYELHTETKGQQFTGSQVGKCDIDIDGFTALYYERLTVAADGSTVIEVYYDRNYYLVDFDLGGGYGVEPIYARYGATIGANDPTRAGYVFAGWELVGVDGVKPTETQKAQYDINDGKRIAIPNVSLTYSAIWRQDETSYTVVYWKENADDTGYSFWGSQIVGANNNGVLDGTVMSGDVVSGSDNIPSSITTTTVDGSQVDERKYFTYNEARTDKNVVVEGDGSTVVNVYYTRNVYTVYFTGISGTCVIEEHTPGTNCNSTLICPIKEHTHNDSCEKSLNCALTEHTEHTEECRICGFDYEHTHSDNCCNHTHTLACYKAEKGTLILDNNHGGKSESEMKNLGNGLYSYSTGTVFTTTHYYVKVGNDWYCSNYNGKLWESSGNEVKIAFSCPHNEHNDTCCKENLKEHTHSDTCYKDSLHTHTDSCYLYSCGESEHSHTDSCYSACTKLTHTHDNSCNQNRDDNVIYVVTAKYEQTIGNVWPTAANFPDITFRGWSIDGVSSTAVSKRINMTADLCDTSDNLKYAKAVTGGSKTYLYYMFESFDQTSAANGNDRILRNGVYYDKSELYYQEVNSSGSWNQKEIMGMSPVSDGVVTSDSNVFLYYTRNRYDLNFQNINTIVKTVSDIMYQYPVKDVKDNNGNLVSSFTPEYPSTLEPNAYYFAGWYTTPECFDGTKFDFSTATMPNGDLTLYAKWAPVQHEVNIYLDATLSKRIGTTQRVDHKDLASAPDEAVENGNYTFAGWFYFDEDGTEKAFVFNSMPINQDLNIYAKWSSRVAVKYEVYYKLQGTNTQIADPTIGSTLAGMNKTFLAKGGADLYSDYQEGYFPTTNSHTVTMSVDGDNVFTFWYVEKESVPYTVRYIDEATGKELLTTKSVTDNKKAVVTEVFEAISGYMPDAYQKRLVLSANNTDENVITFYYTKDEQHAYYRIAHYVQNLSGNGYTEYRSIESVGDINSVYSAEALTISGFEFIGSKSEVNDVVTPSTGTTVSGTLTANGLLIELFYDRIEVNYTVKYLENGTDKVLAPEKTGSGIYGQQISPETYLNIDGYELIGTPTRTLTLAATSERNVIIFYYQEKNITIQYVPVGSGKVSIGSENVLVISGPVNGSIPTPDDGFKFIGWYLDEDCKIPVNLSWIDSSTGKILPQKNADELYEEDVYYAKFEANNTDLTIKKAYPENADYSIDVNQTFIFDIKGISGTTTADIDLTVTVHGDGEITITDLPIGKYTITEQTDWSWRYAPTDGKTSQTITLSPTEENIVTFKNKRAEVKWLDGDSYDVNIFNGTAN